MKAMRRHEKALRFIGKLAVERSRGIDRFGRKRNPAQRFRSPHCLDSGHEAQYLLLFQLLSLLP